MWELGLPAMQAPRCVSDTKVMLSQASQLPHKRAPTVDRGRLKATVKGGSWLACDAFSGWRAGPGRAPRLP
ncbi:hypothetical protein D7M10_26875 [Pseudomonas fluorescens]|nr:hypothetical protein D7M10_26875 [Pseudomonas fluorescens]